MTLSQRSKTNLTGVHPDLIRVAEKAAEMGAQFHVTEGLRPLALQRKYVAEGASKTMKSRHLTGHAFDIVNADGEKAYNPDSMLALSKVFKAAAKELSLPLEWGGDWRDDPDDKIGWDSPHFQLPWRSYPANGKPPQSPEPVSQATLPPPSQERAPAAPLRKSGTIAGAVGTFFSGLGMFFSDWLEILVEGGQKMTELSFLSSVGGNTKSVLFGTLVFSVTLVICRRVKAAAEGKKG
jgi:peptidoglycan LD-endopeptidase CwlK